MPARSTRLFATLAFSLLPAVGLQVPDARHGVVMSFFYACPEHHAAPRVVVKRFGAETAVASVGTPHLTVYLLGQAPERPYRVIGRVELTARSDRTRVDELIDHANRAGRELGGDALVDVQWRRARGVSPIVSDDQMPYLIANVARWK